MLPLISLITNEKQTVGAACNGGNDSRHPLRPRGRTKPRRPYLNEPSVVDRLIRDFTYEALDLVSHKDFMARLDFECRRMNSLFLGGPEATDHYERAPWNVPDQLGEYVLKALQITGETRLAVRDAFMWYVDRLFDTSAVEQRFDEASVEPLIADLREALLGKSALRP